MRALLLLAALGLAACGQDQPETNATAVDENAAAEILPANDVTAIDAVTGESANMAEDVNFLDEANLASPADSGPAGNAAGNTGR